MIVDISAIELGTGMRYDGENGCFTGVFSGYTFVLRVDGDGHCYIVTTWAAEQGFDEVQSINSFLDAFMLRELSPLRGYSHKGNTVTLTVDDRDDVRLDCEEIVSLIQHFSVFLSRSYCRSCCFDCGGSDLLSLAQIDGELRQVCDGCKRKYSCNDINAEAGYAVDKRLERSDYSYTSPRRTDIDITAPQHTIFELRRELEKKSNLLFGISGALAFTFAAIAIWVILGQTRFIPIVQPIFLAFLCATGYRRCAGVLDTRGVVTCSVIIALAVPFSAFLSTLLCVYTEIDDFGGLHSFSLTLEWLEHFMVSPMYANTLSIEICIGYMLTIVCFVFYCKAEYMIVKK